MGVEEPVEETLRGNKFIGDRVKLNPYSSLKFQRLCSDCSFRFMSQYLFRKDCGHKGNGEGPKKQFGIPEEQVLPEQLDGKEVAHYCEYFRHTLQE